MIQKKRRLKKSIRERLEEKNISEINAIARRVGMYGGARPRKAERIQMLVQYFKSRDNWMWISGRYKWVGNKILKLKNIC